MRILLVEDDAVIAETLSAVLEQAQYEVDRVHTLKAALATLDDRTHDFYILDIGLPDGSGFSLCKLIHERVMKPILILSAYDEESQVVLGLDLGADDYMVKPFRANELLGRIHSILRRSTNAGAIMKTNVVSIDTERMKVFKDDQEILLSATEYRLMVFLVKNNEMVLTRTQLLDYLWEQGGEYIQDNALSVNIKRLREKIESDPNHPRHIVTIRGLGYRISL